MKALSKISRVTTRAKHLYTKMLGMAEYLWTGVWDDPAATSKVRLIKTINLSVRTFLDTGLQTKAASLTYTTVLSIVPLFALLLAIGRGFGLQDILQNQLYLYFPGQGQAIGWAFKFVDSYLKQASGGVFVGVGIVFLLWTLISLLSSIERNFNTIWEVRDGRTFFRKITDYTALIVMVPVLMICSSGLSIFMSNTIQSFFNIEIFSPLVATLLDLIPFVLTCVALTLSFLIIPNCKVQLKYALASGVIAGIAFQLLQYLFVSGQMYVSKYNAIYGSFSFLPLLLIWLQLSWMIVLFGCVLTYSSQNIFNFNFTDDDATDISIRSREYLFVVVMSVCVQRFDKAQHPLSVEQISSMYNLPVRLVRMTVHKLKKAGLINDVQLKKDEVGIAPACKYDTLDVATLLHRMAVVGDNHHMPQFVHEYAKLIGVVKPVMDSALSSKSTLIKDIPLPNVAHHKQD